jgi:long-chain acyl-CoA synthetase
MAAIAGGGNAIPNISENDAYLAFLPLAHVLELMAECTLLAAGGCIGYSAPTVRSSLWDPRLLLALLCCKL